jgi:hydroxymethylglutaryl-CoA reductase
MMMAMTDRKFYQLSVQERIDQLIAEGGLSAEDGAFLRAGNGLTVTLADSMSENTIGVYGLPLGVAQNFIVNGRPVLIPMAIEEPSVVAAASNGARLVARNGGFSAEADPPHMIGQIQLMRVPDYEAAMERLEQEKEKIFELIRTLHPTLVKLGGGPVELHSKWFPQSSAGPMMVVYLVLDVRDAMGANAINTTLEKISPLVEELSGGEARLRVLSNFSDRRMARASCSLSADTLAMQDYSGEEVITKILEAAAFADADPYRAVTHNKGVMNGIDAVMLATGNDWRAVEAGAHAWAARAGRIAPLTSWKKDAQGNLIGKIELPLATGIIGGATAVHPLAALSLRMLKVKSAVELAEVTACVGLAQNLAALRALATEGIQKGHMALHARQVAIAAGAKDDQIEKVADIMRKEKKIRLEFAKEILKRYGTVDS